MFRGCDYDLNPLRVLPLNPSLVLNALDSPQPKLVGDVAGRSAKPEVERTFPVAVPATQPPNVNDVVTFDVAERLSQIRHEVVAVALAIGAPDRGKTVVLLRIAERVRSFPFRLIGFRDGAIDRKPFLRSSIVD